MSTFAKLYLKLNYHLLVKSFRKEHKAFVKEYCKVHAGMKDVEKNAEIAWIRKTIFMERFA